MADDPTPGIFLKESNFSRSSLELDGKSVVCLFGLFWLPTIFDNILLYAIPHDVVIPKHRNISDLISCAMMDPVFSLSLHEHFVSEHKDDVSFPNE